MTVHLGTSLDTLEYRAGCTRFDSPVCVMLQFAVLYCAALKRTVQFCKTQFCNKRTTLRFAMLCCAALTEQNCIDQYETPHNTAQHSTDRQTEGGRR
jgi:hypothetical protein